MAPFNVAYVVPVISNDISSFLWKEGILSCSPATFSAQVIVYSIGVGGVALPFVIWFMICYKSFLDVSKISHNPKKDK